MWKSPNTNREPEASEGGSVISLLHALLGASSGHRLEVPDVHREAAYSRNSKVPKYHTIAEILSSRVAGSRRWAGPGRGTQCAALVVPPSGKRRQSVRTGVGRPCNCPHGSQVKDGRAILRRR